MVILLAFSATVVIGHKKKGTAIQKSEKKCVTIGHSIIAATRPRSFNSPILLGNSVYLHSRFESKDAVQLFSKQGFCASYYDTRSYILSAISNHNERILENTFTQFVFDNTDFNCATLDGFNTLHVMGGVQCISPTTGLLPPEPIPKVRTNITEKEIADMGKTDVVTFKRSNGDGLNYVKMSNIDELMPSVQQDAENLSLADVLWFCGKILGTSVGGWHGFMHTLSENMSYEKTYVRYLPFIDMPPTNLNCINTVLHLAKQQTQELNQKTTFVTFDQPLFVKAMDIVKSSSALNDVVIRLGGFHLLMSFPGSIGYFMTGSTGSGLKEALSLVCMHRILWSKCLVDIPMPAHSELIS